jgi:hypothetical protein
MRDERAWLRFLVVFVVVFGTALVTTALAIALIDPLGVSPIRVVSDRYLPQTNRRYIIPTVVRSGRYDSYIVGSSTVHLLDPIRFSDAIGGRFASLSMAASTPHEQVATVRLLARHAAKTLVWGLDVEDWCAEKALPPYHPHVGAFPDWLFDDKRWNDWHFLLNVGVLDLARRKVGAIFSHRHDQPRADGYQRIWARDRLYDPAKARAEIYRHGIGPVSPSYTQHGSAQSGRKLPSVRLIAGALDNLPSEVRIIILFMPIHVARLGDGTRIDPVRLADCKAAVGELMAARNGWVLDAAWANIWTADDENFWDSVHFRDHAADELVGAIKAVHDGNASEWTTRLIVVSTRSP